MKSSIVQYKYFFNKNNPELTRKWMINGIKFINNSIYKEACYAVINPTNFCPVGCLHCLYSSKKFGNKSQRINKKTIKNFIKIANQANLKMLVFSGGGEPFENLEIIIEAIKNIKSLENVIIITSAYFAKDTKTTKKIMDKICNAGKIDRINSKLKEITITMRISRDNYQCKIIPLNNVVNLVYYVIQKSKCNKIRVLIRTILNDGENNDLKLAKKLNLKLKPKKNKKRIYKNLPIIDSLSVRWLLSDDNKIQIPVIYKPMYFTGRAFNKKLESIYSLWNIIKSEENSGTPFNLCIRGPKGEGHNYYETIFKGYNFWEKKLPYIYNTPKDKSIKKIALYIQATGNILVNSGVPDIAPDINKVKNWNHFLNIIYSDPIQRLLIERGPFFIKNIATGVEKDIDAKIEKTNFVFSISLLSLKTPALRLYLTIMAIKHYLKNKKLKIKNSSLKKLIKIDKKYYINMYRQWKKKSKIRKKNNKTCVDPITGDTKDIVYSKIKGIRPRSKLWT